MSFSRLANLQTRATLRSRANLQTRATLRSRANLYLLAGLAALLGGGMVVGSARADDKVAWVSDARAAAEQARQQGRLLLVVQLTGDFTTDVLSSRAAKIYSSISLGEQPVVDFIRGRCVATAQATGGSAAVEELVPKSLKQESPPPLDFAISYVCAPDGRVVHFVPGFVSADRLLKELQWADEHCRDALRFPTAEQPLAVREGHWQSLREADRKLFRAKFPTRWQTDSAPPKQFSADDLAQAIDTAQAVRQFRIVQRLGGARLEDITPRVLRAMTVHANLEATTPHMILAEFPLASLAELQAPLFLGFTGQRAWFVSPRRSELQFWLAQRLDKHKPIVLSVIGTTDSSADTVKFTANPEVQTELANCELLKLSLDELAALVFDAKLAHITYRRGQPPRFVVLDASGKRVAMLTPKESAGRLIQVIHTAADASRGIVRTTTTAGEKSDDAN